jgi:type II secretory pathway pseudopilin PulG
MVLLEVIIALAIFSGVAFSLVMALDAATDAATDRNQVDAATLGLENQMAKISSTRLAETQRSLPDNKSGIAYHLQIAPESLRDDNRKNFNGFFRVTLQASWIAQGRKETRELSQVANGGRL